MVSYIKGGTRKKNRARRGGLPGSGEGFHNEEVHSLYHSQGHSI